MKLYTWKTPNGYKIAIMLEELGLEYEIVPVDINKGEQMKPEFLALNPNHKIPVLDDDGFVLFESGAILMYLAEKFGAFMPQDAREYYTTLEWLMFQMASVGPMFGQANHFVSFAPEKVPYAIERYVDEVDRLMGVMEKRLSEALYLGGEYSIADMATWPWVRSAQTRGHTDLANYPAVQKWFDVIGAREAVQKAIEKCDAAANK